MPAATFDQMKEYGAVVSDPSSVVPERNATRVIAPSGSEAFAVSVTEAGAVKVAPDAGPVKVAVGAVFGARTMNVTELDQLLPPSAS